MRTCRNLLLSVALGASCLVCPSAWAESPEEPARADSDAVQRAREEFTLATALARRGQWLDALSAFERSHGLRPHPATRYNIAFCERALGRYTRARQSFLAALADHEAERGGTMRAEMVEDARSYLREIEQRLARVVITLEQDNVGIAVNGRPLEVVEASRSGRPVLVAGTRSPGRPEAAPAKTFELLLDPGSHVFVLQHDSTQATVVDRAFSPGSSTSLRLRVDTPRAPSLEPATPAADSQPDYTAAYLAWGIGAAGIVSGSIFGIAAINKRSQLQDRCVDVCPPSSQHDIESMDRYATLSNVGFAVGIAGAGVGTYLFFQARSDAAAEREQRARPAPRFVPWVGVRSAGARWSF